ncbi:hypothetical protein OIU85_008343 [Salix viminalis]|uniref:Uncharacterized protein n=1 Tax=Salix viminalis TaxID=40686 RepID=A0A9Q0NXJ4_SALVM|nr:hypothetical protein OIU85_008343 [Salix viminalis]
MQEIPLEECGSLSCVQEIMVVTRNPSSEETGWDYVDEKGLTVDDFIILTMVEDAENGVSYNIRVEPNLELAL